MPLEYSDELPALPDRYAGHREAMEQVPECQTPLFLAVPEDTPLRLGLGEAVSPLRLRGMSAMLTTVKRQVRERRPARG